MTSFYRARARVGLIFSAGGEAEDPGRGRCVWRLPIRREPPAPLFCIHRLSCKLFGLLRRPVGFFACLVRRLIGLFFPSPSIIHTLGDTLHGTLTRNSAQQQAA